MPRPFLPSSSSLSRCDLFRQLLAYSHFPSCHSGHAESRYVLGLPPGLGCMLGLNDEDEVFISRLMPRVGIPPQISFRHGIKKVKIGIFLNANHLPAYLKVAVRVVRVNNGKRDTRITLEIPELLAVLGLTETDSILIPVEPDRCDLCLTFRPDGGYMYSCRCAPQISNFLCTITLQNLFSFLVLTVP